MKKNQKIKNMVIIKDAGTLINSLGLICRIKKYNFIKTYSIEKGKNSDLILKIKMPWYYVFPYSLFKLYKLKKELKKSTSENFTVDVINL